jgi:lipopolysaccharide transport system permease protein
VPAATASAPTEPTVHVIRPSKGWASLGLHELWNYRELVAFLTWRNVLIRYKQTALGIAWAVLQPVFLMVVFSLFFGRFAHVPSDSVPYPIFSYAALLPWTFFANSLTQSSNSLVGSSNLLSKIYFPRLALPISAVLSALIDFALAFLVLIGLMAWYGIYPRPIAVVLLPLLVLLALACALGAGLWLSALNVAYRDVQYVVPFLVQVWLFASFVIVPASSVGEPWRTVFGINPMAGVVTGFRYALLQGTPAPGAMIGVSAAVAVLLLASGIAFFRRLERTFADVV